MNAFLRAVEQRILAEREERMDDALRREAEAGKRKRPPPTHVCACGAQCFGNFAVCYGCRQRDLGARRKRPGPEARAKAREVAP